MSKKRLKEMFIRGYRKILDPYYQGFAAQIAFFFMLSIVPTVILLSQLLGFMEISLRFVDELLDLYVAPNMADTLKEVLDTKSAVSNNIILLVTALWSSSRAQFALMRIANYTYSGGRSTGKYWGERFRSLQTMFLTILTIAVVLIVQVYGRQILTIVFGQVVKTSVLIKLWYWLRWPAGAALYFLVVLYQYYVLPQERREPRSLLPGAILAAAGMVVMTGIYSIYTGFIVDYGWLYGSLSSIVALLFWFYFMSWVLVLGILTNKVWEETKGDA